MQVNWTMNERGHDEEAQSDYSIYIFGKNTSTNWNTIDVSQGSTRRQIFDWACEIWMHCNGGDPSKRAAVLGARTSKKLRCAGSTRFVYPQLCIVPWQRYGMSKPLRGRVCDTGSFACHIAQWYRDIQGDNYNDTGWQLGSKLCECFGARGLRMDAFVLSALHITLDLSFWICLLHSEQWYQAFFGPSICLGCQKHPFSRWPAVGWSGSKGGFLALETDSTPARS